MKPFQWDRGRLVTTLEAEEATLLRQGAIQVRRVLGGDSSEDSTGAGSSSAPPSDPVRERLLPDGHRSDSELAADYRALTEDGLREEKLADADLLLRTVGDLGGKVALDETDAEAWLRTINDLRLALGVGLDVQEDDDPLLLAEQTQNPEWVAYSWLTALQGLLIDALISKR